MSSTVTRTLDAGASLFTPAEIRVVSFDHLFNSPFISFKPSKIHSNYASSNFTHPIGSDTGGSHLRRSIFSICKAHLSTSLPRARQRSEFLQGSSEEPIQVFPLEDRPYAL